MVRTTTRNRFILLAIAVYVVFAMLWTFLSSKLFASYIDSDHLLSFIASLSIFFVLGSVGWFFLTLQAVPANEQGPQTSQASFIDTLSFRGSPAGWPKWVATVFSLAVSAAVLLLGHHFLKESEGQTMMNLFMPAILLSAMLGGLWPGLIATAVVSVGVDYLALKPFDSLAIDSSHELFNWAVLIVSGVTVSLICDVLRRALGKEALQRRLVEAVMTNSQDAVFIKDRDGRYLVANEAIASIVGMSREAIVGHDDKALFDDSSARQMIATDQEIMQGAKTRVVQEQLRTRDGRALDVEVIKGPLLDAWGEVSGVFGMVRASPAEVGERAVALSNYDAVTGLPARELLHDRLNQFLARATRDGSSVAVCSIGLSGLDLISPRLGQQVADRMIQGIARHLSAALRADDTLACVGPRRFVALLSDVGHAEDCVPLLARLAAAAGQPVAVDSYHLSATVSIGVALCPADASQASLLLTHAEQAQLLVCDAVQQHGGRPFRFHDAVSDALAGQRYDVRQQLQQALEREELGLVYLPRIDLINGAVSAVEARVRWAKAENDGMQPDDILQHVRGGELEQAFEDWRLCAVLTQLAQWRGEGQNLSISVRQSVPGLLRSGFLPFLQGLLAAFPAQLVQGLTIELCEAQVQKADPGELLRALEALRALGLHIALTAFGAGPASLTAVQRLPVDALKLDAAVVHRLVEDGADQGLVESIASLAAATGRQLVADGIETLAQGAALVRLGCRLGQGAGIAPPMTAQELQTWLERWRRGDMPWARPDAVPVNRLTPDYERVEAAFAVEP